MEISQIALTHGGKFHADDVFSAALLRIIRPDVQIRRVLEVPEDFSGLVFDVGRGRFDHHQENAEVRENGVPYAAFGLLWRELGKDVLLRGCSPEDAAKEAARFDERFIQPLDADDNTGCGSPIADTVGAFNPAWDSNRPTDECFAQAQDFAEGILRRKFEGIFAVQRAKSLVEAALAEAEGRVVVLPRFAPWKSVLVPSQAEFVVYPSRRGGFSAQVVPVTMDSMEAKCDFPAEWVGLENEALQSVCGLRTLRFCHKGRFLVAAGTKEDAVEACRLALRAAGRE